MKGIDLINGACIIVPLTITQINSLVYIMLYTLSTTTTQGIFFYYVFVKKVKIKVKCTLVHALRLCTGRTVHRGSRGIALLFHDHGTRRG
jgi:hypothetical protein